MLFFLIQGFLAAVGNKETENAAVDKMLVYRDNPLITDKMFNNITIIGGVLGFVVATLITLFLMTAFNSMFSIALLILIIVADIINYVWRNYLILKYRKINNSYFAFHKGYGVILTVVWFILLLTFIKTAF